MSKTSYVLIGILVLCLGVFFFISYFSPVQPKLSTLDENTKSSETLAQATLSLAPTSQTLIAGQSSIIDVFLEAQNATPTVLQFELAYDPMIMTPTSITPGNYFTNAIVLLNDINPRNGRISYALKCSVDYEKDKTANCENTSSEPVAQIAFTVNPLAIARETSVNIMPKTLLETKETEEVVLQTTNAKIIIQGATAPQASLSAVVN